MSGILCYLQEKKLANFIEEKKLNYQSVEEVPNSICDTCLENISMCVKDIQYVEYHTYGEQNNPNWHIARKGMITASNLCALMCLSLIHI